MSVDVKAPVPTIIASDENGNPTWEAFNGVDVMSTLPQLPEMWMVDDAFALAFVEMLRNTSLSEISSAMENAEERTQSAASRQRASYKVVDGVAYIPLIGLMTKRPTCMSEFFGGGASTLIVSEAIRASEADPDVRRRVLHIESPGGDVAGAFDLANLVYRSKKKKPIDAYVADIGASAAYLVASQATRIFTNDNGVLGSIGVYTKLIDTSQQMKERGWVVHIIKAGKFKAIGEPGVAISKEEIAQVQKRVDALQSLFVKAVARGRGISAEMLAQVSDGSTFVGREAIKVGLADGVAEHDDFHDAVVNNKMLKGVNMASDISDVRRWLSDDASDEATDIAEQTDEEQTEETEQTVPTVANELITAIAAAGINNVGDLNKLRDMASIGEKYVATLREQTVQLAVIALGQDDAKHAIATINASSVDSLRSMARAYEKIAVKEGLLADQPKPKRNTAPSGIASVTAEDTAVAQTPDKDEQAQVDRNSLVSTGLYGF